MNNKVSYCYISFFKNGTYNEFINKLKETEYLILDLRDNTGGLLSEALKIANELLSNNSFIINYKNDQEIIELKNEKIFKKIVCIINENTMSSGELIAGLVKESPVDILIGETNSYGKNSIQKCMNIKNTVIKLTIGKFLFKSIGNIEKIGIEPDYICKRYSFNISRTYFAKLSSKENIKLHEFSGNVFALQQRLNFLIDDNITINGKCDIETLTIAKRLVEVEGCINKSLLSKQEIEIINKLFFFRLTSIEYDQQLKRALYLLEN